MFAADLSVMLVTASKLISLAASNAIPPPEAAIYTGEAPIELVSFVPAEVIST